MFRFLQFIVAVILLVGVLILFKKKMHRSNAFVTGLCVVVVISSVCSGVVLNAIPMPTETVRIEATQERNQKSQGNIIGITSVIVDGKTYPIDAPSEGNWYYSKDDAAYFWLNEDDERLTEPVTQEITIEVPVGAGRKLVFLSGEQFGIVRISYGGESETCDLYKSESADKSVSIPDSNRVFDDFIKLCRLGGYSLMIVATLALAFFLVKIVDKERLIKLIYMILSLVAALTFFLNMGLTYRSGRNLFALFYDFNRSFSGNFVLAIILVPMLYKAFLYCGEIYRKNFASAKGTHCITLPAGLFASFMVIGAAFINGKNTLRPIFDNELQVLKSLFAVSGYFAVFFFGITWIFHYLDCVDIYKVSGKKRLKLVQMYFDCLSKKPFRTAFVTLFILYIPYIVVAYPGIFMGDTRHFMWQIYGLWTLNNAHPITPTLFLNLCMKAGTLLFDSCNMGVFIYSFIQFLFIVTIVSLVIKVLFESFVTPKVSILLILYYAFHPRIQYWMFLVAKDILNAAFLLVFVVVLYVIFTRKATVYTYVALGIGDLGAVLFRHDSRYIVLISLILILFTVKDRRRIIAITIACTLGFVLLWDSALSWRNIPRTKPSWSTNASLGIFDSIMVQQTARYIRDAGDEVTQEEREIIDTVFDYEKIASKYEPDDKADGAYSTMRQSVTQADVQAYKETWFKMFLKHPEIYVEATLNHKYQFLYPSVFTTYFYSYATSEGYMNTINNNVNEYAQKEVAKFSYPELIFNGYDVRTVYQDLRESFFRIPFFNLLYTTSSYFWILFIWFAYCILRGSKIAIAIMMPLLVMVLILIAGPCNGMYFRYSYPYALCLPIVVLLGLQSMKQQAAEQQKSIT